MADFQPFEHDVKCRSQSDGSTLTVVYNRAEYPDFGWQGGIHLQIESGNNPELAQWAQAAGLAAQGQLMTIRREGPASGNWIEQDPANPFALNVKVDGFEWELLGPQDQVVASQHTWISELKMKQLSTGEYAVRLTDDFGEVIWRYLPGECKTLN
jgi:hypothetical protein